MKKQLLYALVPIVFIGSYYGIILHVIRGWTTPDGSHGFLIFVVAVYLVWIRRHEILRLRVVPAIMPGSILFAAGCFVYFAGEISSTLVVQMLSMIPVLLGIILLFGGIHYFTILWLPVCYLVFLTGFVEHLLGSFTIYIQQLTAWLAAIVFRLLGYPVFLDQTIIALPHISLEVVRACSGISHIVALLALAIPLAYLTQKTIARKLVLIVSTLFIGLFANGFRIVLIGIYTQLNPGMPVHGPQETLRVTIIFFVGLLLLLLFNKILAGKKPNKMRKENEPDGSNDPGHKRASAARFASPSALTRKQIASFVLGGVIFMATIGLLTFQIPRPVGIARPFTAFPLHIAGFTGRDIDHVGDGIRPFRADSELLRRYENENGQSVDFYIGYFEIQDAKRKMVGYPRSWMHEGSSRLRIEKDGKTFVVNKTGSRDGADPSDIYFWYAMDGRFVKNEYAAKILTFLNGLFNRKTNGAVIVISTRNEELDIAPFLFEAGRAVKTHLGM